MSISIKSSMFSRSILMTTDWLSSLALWTWAMDAEPIGFWLI